MIDLFFIQNNFSGTEKYAQELIRCNKFRSEKLKIHTVIPGRGTKIKITVQEEFTNIEFPYLIEFGAENQADEAIYLKQCAYLLQLFIHPDHTTIVHGNHEFHMYIGANLKKQIPVKLIQTLHYLPEKKDLQLVADFYKQFFKPNINQIITVTEYGKKTLLGEMFGIDEQNINRVYNGVGDKHSQVRYNRKKTRNTCGFSNREKLILYVGRIEKDKGITQLLKAFLQLANEQSRIRLVIAGSGQYENLFEQIKTHQGQITLLGKRTREELDQLYQIADIGVIPSKIEQCSYVALEMMSYGLPVVASDIDGLKELYVGESFARLVPVDPESGEINIDKLKDAIKELLITDNREIRRQARQKWRAHYQARHMAEATLKIYQQLSQEK